MLKVALLSLFSLAIAQQTVPSGQGSWRILSDNSVVCIHTIVLPNNIVLCFERPHDSAGVPYGKNERSEGEVASLTDLNTNTISITRAQRNPFCAGHAHMANGDVLVVGGDYPVVTNAAGLEIATSGIQAIRKFRPCKPGVQCTPEWIFENDMSTARWYPSVLTLANGESLIASGSLTNLDFTDLSDTNNPTYEYYPARSGDWPRRMAILDDTFPFNLYPAVVQLSTGKVMIMSANKTAILNTEDDSIDDTSIPIIDVGDKNPWIYPHTPAMVQLPLTAANGYTSKIMTCGGSTLNQFADNRCVTIDFADPNPSWKLTTPMAVGRIMPNAVLLPDGSIMYNGGIGFGLAGGDPGNTANGFNPVFDAEIYYPDNDQWVSVAPMTIARLYHSGSVLLQDGTVMVAGSEFQNYVDQQLPDCFPNNNSRNVCTDPFEFRSELFTPPYMSLGGDAPVIASVPEKTRYGTTFTISMTSDGGAVSAINAIRYSSATHSTNFDQRFVQLKIVSQSANEIVVESPRSGNVAPPGYWHIFALTNGKPGIAATMLFEGDGSRSGNVNAGLNLGVSSLFVVFLIGFGFVY